MGSYWKERCLLAEAYISESPCDPDITIKQLEAHSEWNQFKKACPGVPELTYWEAKATIYLNNSNIKCFQKGAQYLEVADGYILDRQQCVRKNESGLFVKAT